MKTFKRILFLIIGLIVLILIIGLFLPVNAPVEQSTLIAYDER